MQGADDLHKPDKQKENGAPSGAPFAINPLKSLQLVDRDVHHNRVAGIDPLPGLPMAKTVPNDADVAGLRGGTLSHRHSPSVSEALGNALGLIDRRKGSVIH